MRLWYKLYGRGPTRRPNRTQGEKNGEVTPQGVTCKKFQKNEYFIVSLAFFIGEKRTFSAIQRCKK